MTKRKRHREPKVLTLEQQHAVFVAKSYQKENLQQLIADIKMTMEKGQASLKDLFFVLNHRLLELKPNADLYKEEIDGFLGLAEKAFKDFYENDVDFGELLNLMKALSVYKSNRTKRVIEALLNKEKRFNFSYLNLLFIHWPEICFENLEAKEGDERSLYLHLADVFECYRGPGVGKNIEKYLLLHADANNWDLRCLAEE